MNLDNVPSWLQKYAWYAPHLRWLEGGSDGSRANLSDADLRRANLRGANLSDADLRRANLSGVAGLLSATDWLASSFDCDEYGVIVYKRIGNGKTSYEPASHWLLEPGEFLTEVVNSLRTDDCGCGVNFGTLEWVTVNYHCADIWKCRIRWIDHAGVVVPYNTDGKARCARLELLGIEKYA